MMMLLPSFNLLYPRALASWKELNLIRMKIPLILGQAIEILGVVFAFSLLVIAAQFSSTFLRFLLYLVSWGSFVFFPHSLMHYVVGRLVGVRFKYYFVSKSAIGKLKLPLISAVASGLPVLGLKVDRVSLRSVSRGGRAVMFVSGAVASMILPFFVVMASFNQVPYTMSLILLLISAGNAAFDLYYSPRAGDISRVK